MVCVCWCDLVKNLNRLYFIAMAAAACVSVDILCIGFAAYFCGVCVYWCNLWLLFSLVGKRTEKI